MRVHAISLGLVVAAAGCGQIGDGQGSAGGEPDAGDQEVGETPPEADGGAGEEDAGAEDGEVVYGPFVEPQPIAALASPGSIDDDAAVTGDMLELYFNSNRPGGAGLGDIYVATRDAVDKPWRAPRLVAGINTAHQETSPEISADGRTLYFSSDRPGGQGGQDIYLSTRPTRASPWSAPVVVAELSSPYEDFAPSIDRDGTHLVFSSTRDGGDNDLFKARRTSAAAVWDAPVLLTSLVTSNSETDPHLSRDGLTLYFAAGPAGTLDIYRATRESRASDFGGVEPVAEVNANAHDADPWVSSKDIYMVMTSARSGDAEIYESWREVVE